MLVALAPTGWSTANRLGKVSKVPPPAIELIAPAASDAPASKAYVKGESAMRINQDNRVGPRLLL